MNYKKDFEVPVQIINKIKKVVSNNNVNEKLEGISLNEANVLLSWLVNRTWKNLSHFGIDLSRNSLSGFCEIAQISTLYALEELGLKVTKNTAHDSFGYSFHHAFGTVLIPINYNGVVINSLFLVDPTYKQFFTAVRCNHGRYYTKEENTGMIVAPDPGYFMKNENEKLISENIIRNGFILLTESVAKVYGDGFKKASVSLENYDDYEKISNYSGKYYIDKIKNTSTKYCTKLDELEGYFFEIGIPSNKNINNK